MQSPILLVAVAVTPVEFLAAAFFAFVSIVAFLLWVRAKGFRVEREMVEYADKIGAVFHEEMSCEEFLKPFAAFELMNRFYRNRSTARRVVYPSDFGDIHLFFYQYADSPPGAPAGSFRCVTVLACRESFGIGHQIVSTNLWSKFVEAISARKDTNNPLKKLIAKKRRCQLEVNESGTMLHFMTYIYQPKEIPRLVFEFTELLRNMAQIAQSAACE
ncbi:hypothetical protein [Mariniblastus fucicola]|uniref:Uncharacterized protein n=1 Tax=Mariniblastus fucicola TaxID=980251 RepID=A0A5B9P7E6_9BACT|nr:hypothetical protein [Mariniblastus fucicola]QEG22238.1 hypothetical protein MFFC18_21140 [Mariniblastus fucicola]